MRTDGAASSTSWRKLIRGITLIEVTGGEIREIFRTSHTVRYRKIDNRNISEEQVQREYTEATVIFILWMMSIAMGVAVLLRVLSPPHSLEYVIFAVMSDQSGDEPVRDLVFLSPPVNDS
jgi:trk system potassium uptake protein TrkH